MKRKLGLTGIILLFLIGFLVLMYPFISDVWNQLRTKQLVSSYQDKTDALPKEQMKMEFQRAREYNRAHEKNTLVDAFGKSVSTGEAYQKILDPMKNGIMGYIEIPKISQRLVIYHGTGKEVLEKGCGHIAGTSLPVGGKSTHAVIAAHRGLPSAKLFTDLDQMKEGDRFYLFILDKTLAYEVDQIKVVEPDCLEELQITEGKDYVTLFTCTPYSVNTHRLLVRGHRVKYVPDENNTETIVEKILHSWITKLLVVLFTICLILLISRKIRYSKLQLF